MEELVKRCAEERQRKNHSGVMELANAILIEVVKEIVSGTRVERSYKEVVKSVAQVANSCSGSRYKNTEYAEAHLFLGKVFETGIFYEKNVKKALSHYTEAAENANPTGCYKLAYFCEHGICCSKDMEKAAHFYKLAANGGCGKGAHRYGKILLEGEGGCKKDIKGGVFYLEQAKKLSTPNYPHAFFDLGLCYEGIPLVGSDVPQELEYALKIYQEGDKMGCPRSAVRLGNAYHYGELGLTANLETAVGYYKKAKEVSSEACFELYKIYKNDAAESLAWIKSASELGHPDAIRIYARMLEIGEKVSQNRTLALWWYKIAMERGVDTSKEMKRCKM